MFIADRYHSGPLLLGKKSVLKRGIASNYWTISSILLHLYFSASEIWPDKRGDLSNGVPYKGVTTVLVS
jgi:hypothetical protein